MKIKYFVLMLIVFMMCGCTAEVNLEINDNKMKESVDITFYQNAIYTKDIIRTSFRNYIPIYATDVIVDAEEDRAFPDIKYYEKTETDLGNGYLFNYKYDFDIDEYREARTVKDGFKSYNVSYDNTSNTLTLSTNSGRILYFDDYPLLEEVTVNIKTDYLVEEDNADKVNGNTYTWIFNKDSKKSINMLIDTSVNNDDNNSVFIGIGNNIFPIICIVAVVLVVLLLMFLKNNKNNKI